MKMTVLVSVFHEMVVQSELWNVSAHRMSKIKMTSDEITLKCNGM